MLDAPPLELETPGGRLVCIVKIGSVLLGDGGVQTGPCPSDTPAEEAVDVGQVKISDDSTPEPVE